MDPSDVTPKGSIYLWVKPCSRKACYRLVVKDEIHRDVEGLLCVFPKSQDVFVFNLDKFVQLNGI